MEDLAALYPQVKSVSVVPVGLTRYRKGLYPLRPYTVAEAREVVGQVEAYGARCLGEKGSRIFWCSDEFYLQGELPLPEDAFYEAYTQLENGVGMLRLLEVELNGAPWGPLRTSRWRPSPSPPVWPPPPFCGKSLTGRPQNVRLN